MSAIPRGVVELLRHLVRIPSVNPAGNPGTDGIGEQRCAEAIGEFLQACGARVELQEVKPGRPNVVGMFPSASNGRGAKKRIVLAPHTDTVSVAGMTIDPFGAELIGGKVYGRGASDTKGPMAAMLWALHEMRERLPLLEHEICFAGLMGEEAGQDGAREFVAGFEAGFALVGEPTDLKIVHMHKGATWMKLTSRGRACHASAPEQGENAIYKMADLIRCIRDEIAPELRTQLDPILGTATANVGICAGGSKANIVPDFCEAQVDFRTLPSQDAEGFLAWVSERLRRVDPDVEIEATQSKPLFTDPAHPMVRALEKAGGKCGGASWFCDAAIFSEAGIPAVAAGPGSILQAHTRDEWIAVEELERGVAFYRSFLENC